MGTSWACLAPRQARAGGGAPVDFSQTDEVNLRLDQWRSSEVQLLLQRFSAAKGPGGKARGLTRDAFARLFPELPQFGPAVPAAAFALFDAAGTGEVLFRDFCAALLLCCRGSPEEQAGVLARLFADSPAGDLTADEVRTLVRAAQTAGAPELDVEDAVRAVLPPDAETLSVAQLAACLSAGTASLSFALSPFEVLPSPGKERALVDSLMPGAPREEGAVFYAVALEWWQAWEAYARGGEFTETQRFKARPGAIDSTALQAAQVPGELRRGVREGVDFVLWPEPLWAQMHAWYGGGPVFARACGADGEVDLHPPALLVEVCEWDGRVGDLGGTYFFRPGDSLADVKARVCAEFELPAKKARLWNATEWALLEDLTLPLDAAAMSRVLVETCAKAGSWPRDYAVGDAVDARDSRGKWYSGQIVSRDEKGDGRLRVHFDRFAAKWDEHYDPRSPDLQPPGSHAAASASASAGRRPKPQQTAPLSAGAAGGAAGGRQPGVCGLDNLGNTCYMNSSLQCLSNAPLLSQYFLSALYRSELNTDNPLGSRGKLAEEFADLLRQLWDGSRRSIAPERFRRVMCRALPSFSGYDQHDSQEFVGALLDMLHEDLNRVIQKPYVENAESNGRPDAEVAAEAWEKHLSRNRSVVVDLFQGQYKSEVVCPVCDTASVTFDPFQYLVVPIPDQQERVVEVTLWRSSGGGQPVTYGVGVPRHGDLADVKAALGALAGVPAANLSLLDVQRGVPRIYSERDPVGHLQRLHAVDVPQSLEELDLAEHEARAPEVPEQPEPEDFPRSLGEVTEGLRVDAKDSRGKWYAGRVVEAAPARVMVHFDGFSCKWDEPYSVSAFVGGRVLPPHTKTKPKPVGLLPLTVVHRKRLVFAGGRGGGRFETFGTPFVVATSTYASCATLRAQVLDRVREVFAVAGAGEPRVTVSLVHVQNPVALCGYCAAGIGKCAGCELPDSPLYVHRHIPNKAMLAVDWEAPDEDYDASAQEPELHRSADEARQRAAQAQERPAGMSLQTCLDAFTKAETLDEDTWYCGKCKEHQRGLKSLTVWKAPDILIVILKRFHFTARWREKVRTMVHFPLSGLDMGPWVAGEEPEAGFVYDLFAVTNHHGEMNGGHYTAFVQNPDSGTWHDFDDEQVVPISTAAGDSQVVTADAYVLYYKRAEMSSSNIINLTA